VHELRSPLIQLVDLTRLWARCNPDVVFERAAQARIVGAVIASFDLLELCLGIALPRPRIPAR